MNGAVTSSTVQDHMLDGDHTLEGTGSQGKSVGSASEEGAAAKEMVLGGEGASQASTTLGGEETSCDKGKGKEKSGNDADELEVLTNQAQSMLKLAIEEKILQKKSGREMCVFYL